MALQQLPPKPTRNGSWDAWGDTVDGNVRQLITEVPALTAVQFDVAARLARAETTVAQSTADVAAVRADIASAQTTAQSAAVAAASARSAADTAQAAAAQAAADASAAAQQASTVTDRVGTNTADVAALKTGKVDVSALATVAVTGRYADLIGAPTGGGAASTAVATTFTGAATGAAWPAPWVPGQTPTGGSVTVQAEKGQLVTGSVFGNYDSQDGASARYGTQLADFTAVYTFRRVGSAHCRFVARSDTATLDPANGVIVGTEGSTFSIVNVNNYAYTTVAGVAKTWTRGIDYRVRITFNGGTVQARTWDASTAEPSGWDITGAVTRTAAGHLGFWAGTDAVAASQAALYDDITIDTPTSGGAPALDLATIPTGRPVHTNGATRPTTRTDVPVTFHTLTPPTTVMNLAAGDVWDPSTTTAATPSVWL